MHYPTYLLATLAVLLPFISAAPIAAPQGAQDQSPSSHGAPNPGSPAALSDLADEIPSFSNIERVGSSGAGVGVTGGGNLPSGGGGAQAGFGDAKNADSIISEVKGKLQSAGIGGAGGLGEGVGAPAGVGAPPSEGAPPVGGQGPAAVGEGGS